MRLFRNFHATHICCYCFLFLGWAYPNSFQADLLAQKSGNNKDLELLVSWMQGSYNSYQQSLSDTNYLNIVLEMHPVWQHRTDGKWLYVEQSVAENTSRPYRQRIYQIVAKGKNSFESRIYTLPQPERYVGQWSNQTLFNQINPQVLTQLKGCAVTLKKNNQTFTGQTGIKSCPSELKSAAYATSKVTITENSLSSWDQGFDQTGKQVWGAENGPYQFIKTPNQLPMKYPDARVDNQTDNYFGTIVADPYRWMEDENSAETQQWINQQNNLTNQYLESTGFQNVLSEQLTRLINYPKVSAPRKQGDYYYFFKNNGLQNHSVFYRQKGLTAAPEKFLDPNTFSEDGSVALTTTSFSKDYKYMVYGTSLGGSDWQTFQVLEVESGKPMSDTLHNIKFSGAAWYKNGFFYTRFDQPEKGKELSAKNEAARVFYHKIGTPQSEDILVYENKQNPRLSFWVSVTEDEQFILLSVSSGSSSGNALYYAYSEKWKSGFYPIMSSTDQSLAVVDNLNDKLLVKTNYKAPNYRLVLIDPRKPEEQFWKTVLAEQTDAVLDNVYSANGNLLVEYMKDVNSHLRIYTTDGVFLRDIPLPGIGIAGGISADKKEPVCFYSFESFLYPPTIFKYDLTTHQNEVFYQPEIDFDFSDFETKQVFYRSKDGTKVPMFITHKKGISLNSQHPCLLYSYGGFNISRIPEFKIENLPFYQSGGIYAVANLRGGSEYGEEWHKAGMLEKKQNVFDDYIAAAEYLIKEGYTRPQKLAATGRSNGGLLIGAVMNQRPELFAVALPVVGVMDMLRFHKFTIGWAWVSEYGSSDNAEQFKFLYPYSPYHNIRPGLPYPATMVMTAQRDDRVVPAHSYKYTARLQHDNTGNQPQLIRIESMSGHGGGGQGKTVKQIIDTYTDVWSFVFKHLGMFPVIR